MQYIKATPQCGVSLSLVMSQRDDFHKNVAQAKEAKPGFVICTIGVTYTPLKKGFVFIIPTVIKLFMRKDTFSILLQVFRPTKIKASPLNSTAHCVPRSPTVAVYPLQFYAK